MRKLLAVAVSVVALFGFIAPASAQAPAPKVTINGLLDFVTTGYHNWSGAGGSLDATKSDEGWYSRERGVFTFTGEIGKTKAVWAVENDFTNGAGLLNGGNAFNGGTNGTAFPGTSANLDMDNDVASVVETKWLYLETPITGPGSLLPFIPVSSIVRAGGQPARGHEYKVGILQGGDFPGVTIETSWAPNLRSTLTWVQIAEQLDKYISRGQNESYAINASVEWDVFKGLTVKPTYSYANYNGGNCGTSNLGTEVKDGFNVNNCSPSTTGGRLTTTRHTFGGDVRWTSGPFSLQPTILWQMGTQECVAGASGCTVNNDNDINTWIFDTTAGFRTGPLNIEGRFMWTPGQDPQHKVANGADVNYYQSIDPAFAYMAGWTEIQTAGVDYITSFQAGAPGIALRQSPSYDKYGRLFAALAVDYSLTPALTLRGLVNASWTDAEVYTGDPVATTGRLASGLHKGSLMKSYLGTEVNAGFTYRFAPNVAFDGIYAYMWTGGALNQPSGSSTVTDSSLVRDADDVWKAVARMRVTF